MATPLGEKSARTPTRSKPQAIGPKIEPLGSMPETPEELFRALAITVTGTVNQPDPKGKKAPKKQEYALPWAGYETWRDARARLDHFEGNTKSKVSWAPFNDSHSNDGPMSLNAYPGRAFIERVTNEGDANLERVAMTHQGPMPKSPADAAALWFKLSQGALATGLENDQARQLAMNTVTVRAFVGDPKDPRDCILDARDYGIGLTGAEMPGTILSLNRGLKKSKAYLTGKHGQGASSTYQYSNLTLIASRKVGASKVAFTLVEATWDRQNGELPKTPTYKYLTLDGKVPEIDLSEEVFPVGTLVRHIGYNAADLFGTIGEQSLYGQLMRSLAEPLFPVWHQMYTLRPGTAFGFPVAAGYRRHRRLIRGTVNSLERAWAATLKSEEAIKSEEGEDDDDHKTKILHRASEYYQLPKWDLGGREGMVELGRVKINYWVADPAGRSYQDVLKNWVDPEKTILMTLDGQTHAEESRSIITGHHGAKLWAVGKYMVVQIDCNGLDPRAKYEMFTSTREHAKETPIRTMIVEELIRRLGFDPKLAELNVQLAAADIKQPEDQADNISKMIKKYLKNMGVSFEQLTRKLVKWTEVEEEKEVPVSKPEPPPIEAQEPPTFVRWKFAGPVIKLYPGQKYSYVFETDAAPSYWNPADPSTSKIKVLSYGIRYVGAGEMRGGRVRCHFECPQDQTVGAKGFIQVQLDYAMGQSKFHRVPVEIIEKPKPKPPKPPRPEDDDKALDDDGQLTKTIKVKIKKKDFTEVDIPIVKPIPVGQGDTAWHTLGWPHDPHRVGFSIRAVQGKIQLYYNKEFPPFLDLRRKMSRKSLESEFVKRYEMKLILHTIFTLNYDFVDEEEFTVEQKKQVRDMLCATAESLALATKSEIEIEAKVKSEDGGLVGVEEAAGSSAEALASGPAGS